MDTLVVQKLEQIAKQLDPPFRKRKASHMDVVTTLMSLLKSGIPWRCISKPTATYHTYFKRFCKWMHLGVFEKVCKQLLEEYSIMQLQENCKWFKELYIDSTMIKNVGGCDSLGKNPSDRGRLATKLSVICDNKGVPISSTFFPANQNDITTVLESVAAIACNTKVDGRVVTTLVGDKAYTSKPISTILMKRNIRMIAPLKNNARKKKLSKADEKLLKKRGKIEHVFCRLDKFRRIHCRHEKRLIAYEALNYLAMAVIVGRHLG